MDLCGLVDGVLSHIFACLGHVSVFRLCSGCRALHQLQDREALWIPLCRAFQSSKGSRRSKRQRVAAYSIFVVEQKATRRRHEQINLLGELPVAGEDVLKVRLMVPKQLTQEDKDIPLQRRVLTFEEALELELPP